MNKTRKDSMVTDEKMDKIRLFVFINGKKYNNNAILFTCEELLLPYNNSLLNFAALERSLVKAIPEELFKVTDLGIEKMDVMGDVVSLHLSNSLEYKSAYRIVGALRLFNIQSGQKRFGVPGLGYVVSSAPGPKMISQTVSTWKTYDRSKFSDLDYEIRNYRLYRYLLPKFGNKFLERYFVDSANFMVLKGDLPKHTVFVPELIDEPGFNKELFGRELSENLPKLSRGKLTFDHKSLTWSDGKETFKFRMNKRHRELLARPGISIGDLAKVVVRYGSMGAAGQFTMTPRSVVKHLVTTHDIRYEGFGAPFNVDLPFCSLMFDIDLPFGSMGPFNWEQLVRRKGNWSINPPFTPQLLAITMSNVLKACEHLGPDDYRQYHVLFPNWEDLDYMDILTGKEESKYLVSTTVMDVGDFAFERIGGDKLFYLFGGLVYSVFSPVGKRNKDFTEAHMQQIRDEFKKNITPEESANVRAKYPYVPWRELQEMGGKEAAKEIFDKMAKEKNDERK